MARPIRRRRGRGGLLRRSGVSELRHATGWQVHGIAYEAMRSAVEQGQRFSIVCALPSAVPIMEQLAAHYGWADMLVSVRPLGISVLDIAAALEDTASRLEQVIDDCVSDGADAVCLGCASMTPGRGAALIGQGADH